MIFVTVGSQTGFDRFVEAVDRWAAQHPGVELFCQIGGGDYEPRHMPFVRLLEPADYLKKVAECAFLVAHAGTGSILSASEAGKPIIVFPRHGKLKETRNDHQLATARWMTGKAGVYVAWDEPELHLELDARLAAAGQLAYEAQKPDELINNLRHFFQTL